jgi:hypothetical protein
MEISVDCLVASVLLYSGKYLLLSILVLLVLPEVYLLIRRIDNPAEYQPSMWVVVAVVVTELGMLVLQSLVLVSDMP